MFVIQAPQHYQLMLTGKADTGLPELTQRMLLAFSDAGTMPLGSLVLQSIFQTAIPSGIGN